MINNNKKFERIARKSGKYSYNLNLITVSTNELHPFEERNIHPAIHKISKKLFDDGHYSHATFDAFKYVDKQVQKISKIKKSGVQLMMQAFSETSPVIKLTDLSNESEKDEQQGYKFLFAGSIFAIRNPRGHEVTIQETPDQCLDHISLASMLLRRLNDLK